MGNLRTLKPRTLGPLNLENTGNLSTDQHRNTANTISLGKDMLSRAEQRSSVWVVGNSTIRTTTPKVGKADHTAFPAGQAKRVSATAVSVAAAHSQAIECKGKKGGCCPNVAH